MVASGVTSSWKAAGLAALALVACSSKKPRAARTPAEASDEAPAAVAAGPALSPKDYVARMGRGLDVDWSKTRRGAEGYAARVPADFKAVGLGHVRIRVRDPISEELLSGLAQQVDDSLAAGLMPVVAYQADAFKDDPSDAQIDQAVAWWRAVAVRLQDRAPLLSFDLLIEATDALNKQPDRLARYYERAIAEIRRSNPTRVLFVSPRVRSSPEYLDELPLPDDQVAAEWHFYAAGPSKTNPVKRWTTGTAEERQLVSAKIAAATAWQARTGRASWVGAWMPGNYNDENDFTVAEQVGFATFVACELDRAGIPFAVNSDSKFYDPASHTWIAAMRPVLDAFVRPACGAR